MNLSTFLVLNGTSEINDSSGCELWDNASFVDNLTFVMSITWSAIAVVGILSNACVLFVMLCNTRILTVTQYFIINLALSDMVFLIICPTFTIISYNQIIIFDHIPDLMGSFFCKLDYFSTHVSYIKYLLLPKY